MLSGSSPIFALSNHTTCSRGQTGATVPLNRISGSDDCAALGSVRVARCSWVQAAECYTGKYASLPPPP